MLNITLTSRGDGVPLAGVPVKAAADYLRQLVAAGQRVAICEQVEDPKLARGWSAARWSRPSPPGPAGRTGGCRGSRNNCLVAVTGRPAGKR